MQIEFSQMHSSRLSSIWSSKDQGLFKALDEFTIKFPLMRPESFTANALRGYFSAYVDQKLASNFTAMLMGLAKGYYESNLTKEDLVKHISETQGDDNKSDSDNKFRNDLAERVWNLLQTETISFVYKGSKLYFEINETPESLEIITEIRPVFSKDAASLKAFIIRNVLHVKEQGFLKSEEHEFSLSKKQLVDLQEKCERALKKLESARLAMAAVSENGVAIFGDDYDN